MVPLQKRGLKILSYLDGWSVGHPASRSLRTQRMYWPTFRQVVPFLGSHLDSSAVKAHHTPRRVAKIQDPLRSFRHGRFLCLQKLLGLISDAAMLVTLGLLIACPLQRWLNSFKLQTRRDRHRKLEVTRSCLGTLCPRRKRLLVQGVPLGCILLRGTLVSRCLPDGRGSSVGGQNSERSLAASMEHRTQKHIRTSNSISWPQGPLTLLSRQTHPCDSAEAVCYINHQGGTRSLHCLKMV